MAVDEYLRRKNLERASRRRAAEARPTPTATFPVHRVNSVEHDRHGSYAASYDCDCSIGHDHEAPA